LLSVLMIPRIVSSESGSDSRMVRTFPALESVEQLSFELVHAARRFAPGGFLLRRF
jgi:hypothetical protein